MSDVIIMRGIPGSGKSTYVKTFKDATVCSADDYHIVNDVYAYNPSYAPRAHNLCLGKFVNAVVRGKLVIVDNTNTTEVELAPYVRVAEAFGAYVKIICIWSEIGVAIRRQTHGVPGDTVLKMYANLSNSIRWPQEIIFN